MDPLSQLQRGHKASLIIGASSGIAKAMIRQLSPSRDLVIAVSRQAQPEDLTQPNLLWLTSDYSLDSIATLTHQLHEHKVNFSDISLFNGLLHGDGHMPEKKLEDVNTDYLQQLFQCNVITPTMWLQQLLPTLSGQWRCIVTVLTARVASISDNRLGGWYGYRSTKAALNMMLKTASVELKRRAKGVKLVSFHPGTTDTPLSEPFQKNVPKGKLFTPEFVAKQLLSIHPTLTFDGELSYLDWQGQNIDF